MKKTTFLALCLVFSFVASAQQNGARPAGNAAALLQHALAAVAGMKADVNSLQDSTARLNLRIEELERQIAERDQKIARLENLCATQNTQLQNLETQFGERLAAIQNALEKDRKDMQRNLQQLGKDLSADLAAARPATTVPTPAYTGKLQEFKVQAGDTVGTIAKAAGCTIKEIVEINNLKSADSIRIGQVLKVPVK